MAWLAVCVVGLNRAGRPAELVVFGLVLVGTTLALFVAHRLYRSRMCSVRALETAAVLRECTLGGLFAWMLAGRFMVTTVRIRAVVVAQLLAVCMVFVGRAAYRSALKRARATGRHARPVVLVGGGEEVYELHKLLTTEPELGYEVVGVVGSEGELSAWATDLVYLGPLHSVVQVMQEAGAGGAIVAGSGLSFQELNAVVRGLMEAGLHMQLFGGLLGIDPGRLQVSLIGRQAAFYLEHVQLSSLRRS